MRKGIEETDKSFVFYREIGKNPVTVALRCGWIWIEETINNPGFLNPFRKTKKIETFTIEDARNLSSAIRELIPEEETEKRIAAAEALKSDTIQQKEPPIIFKGPKIKKDDVDISNIDIEKELKDPSNADFIIKQLQSSLKAVLNYK